MFIFVVGTKHAHIEPCANHYVRTLRFGDRIAVVGNTGSNNTGELNANTAYGFAAGMDAALVINPYYGRTSTEGIIRHLEVGMK